VNDEASPRPESHDAPNFDSPVFRREPAAAPGAADSVEPPWWRRAHVIAVTVVALVLIVVALIIALRMNAARHAAATDPNEQAPLVTVKTVGSAAITSTVSFTGGIVARYDMPIGVEGEGGRVSAVLVESGDRVTRGQVLARLEPAVVEAQVASLKATLEQYRAEAALATADYRRAAAVSESVGALSKEEVDRRQSQVATSAARVKAAEAQLAEAEARLGRTEIRAPSDGIVLTRTAEVGQTAMPGGATLFRLARGGEVEMRAQVAEQDLPRLKVGQAAEVHLTGIATPFAGRVRLISAVIDPATRLGEVRVALQPHPDLRPGAFARGEVKIGTDLRPVVPQTAVLSDGAVNFVYIVGPDLRAARRPVHIAGTQSQGIVIDRGLDGSERIVTSAGAFLHDGERVQLAQAQAAP
jgi:RND family efflux transporter MFP subunit